jgi:hypothetical protein
MDMFAATALVPSQSLPRCTELFQHVDAAAPSQLSCNDRGIRASKIQESGRSRVGCPQVPYIRRLGVVEGSHFSPAADKLRATG